MSVRASLLLMLGACTPDLDDVSTVEDLRILAVSADPPEILLAPDDVDPAALPPIALNALVADPAGQGRSVHFRVSVCGNQPAEDEAGREQIPGTTRSSEARGPCPSNAPVIAEGERQGRDGHAIVDLTFSWTGALLALVDAGSSAASTVPSFGLPVRFDLTVTAGPQDRDQAIKRILVGPRLDPAQEPNRNPMVGKLFYRAQDHEPWTELDPAAPPAVRPGVRLRLTPEVGDRPGYPALTFDRTAGRLQVQQVPRETLRYAFFATRGTFSPAEIATESPAIYEQPPPFETTYQAPAELTGVDHVDVWLVVRDERAGCAWHALRLPVGATARTALRTLP